MDSPISRGRCTRGYGFFDGGFGSGVSGTVKGVTGFNGGGGGTFASRSPAMSFRFATTRH